MWFDGGKIHLEGISSLGSTAYDVIRIKQSALDALSGDLQYQFDSSKVKVPTIKKNIEELKLQASINSNGEIVLMSNVDGNNPVPLSLKSLSKAIKDGYLAENCGTETFTKEVLLQLEYKDAAGRPRNIAGRYRTGQYVPLAKKETSTSNQKKIWFWFDYDQYVREEYVYWGTNYFQQPDCSLYLGFYIPYGNSYRRINLDVDIPITNGKEEKINGERTIECFKSITNGNNHTLQQFLDLEVEIPDEAYVLSFLDDAGAKTLEKDSTTGKYKTNYKGEILFTVDKTSVYVIDDKSNYDVYIALSDGTAPVGKQSGKYPIMNAGISSAGNCVQAECEKIKYRNGELLVDFPTEAYPLVENVLYAINVSDDINSHEFEFSIYTLNGAEIDVAELMNHKTANQNLTSQEAYGVEQMHFGGVKVPTMFEKLEFHIARPIRNMANGIVKMVNSVMGELDSEKKGTITIDTIVFDDYPLTQLSLFTRNLGSGESQHEFTARFAHIINDWHRNFLLLAVVVYLIVLLYMGVRIVLNSTGEQKAIFKELFVHWIVGIMILFIFPVVIRYAIKINTSFVQMIKKTVEQQNGGKVDSSIIIGEHDAPDENSTIATNTTINEEAEELEKNPFDQKDRGYMATMARRAHLTERLSYAVVYFIMAIQLVIIAIMYYKRLFMVAFLIVIFPIIMIAFVLEKVANIKMGNSFATWTREIFINIFIQSIHAIVYSFSLSTVAKSDQANDWILMVIGTTFLFNGEEVMKKILGQNSDTAPSLGDTAKRGMALASGMMAGAKTVTDNVKDTAKHMSEISDSFKESRKHRRLAQAMDILGKNTDGSNVPSAEELDGFKSEYKEYNDQEAYAVGNAVQVMNNLEEATPEQIGNAIDVINQAKQAGKYNALLNNLNMSDEQFEGLQAARDNAARDAISGNKTKEQIDMDMKLELERLMPGVPVEAMQMAFYKQMSNPLYISRLTNRDTSLNNIKDEIATVRERYRELNDRIKIADDKKGENEEIDNRLAAHTTELLGNIYGVENEAETTKHKNVVMALNVTMLKEATASGEALYDSKELITAANYVKEHMNDSEEFAKMAKGIGYDIDEYRHVLAEKINRKAKSENYRSADKQKVNSKFGTRLNSARKISEKVLEEYEGESPLESEYVEEKVTVSEVMEQEYKLEELTEMKSIEDSEELFALKVQEKRQKWNTKSQEILSDFSGEMMSKHKRVYQKKIDGLTKQEHMELARAYKNETVKQIVEDTAKDLGTIPLAIAFGAAGIGMMDQKSAGQEFLLTYSATKKGLEGAANDKEVTRTVEVPNPYTGEKVKIDVTLAEELSLVLSDANIISDIMPQVKKKFLEQKIRSDNEYEMQRKNAAELEREKKLAEKARQQLKDKFNNTNT